MVPVRRHKKILKITLKAAVNHGVSFPMHLCCKEKRNRLEPVIRVVKHKILYSGFPFIRRIL